MIKDLVTIKAASEAADTYSGGATDWSSPTTVATVWAEIEAGVEGSEPLDTANKPNSQQMWRLKIHHRTDVTTKQRVFWRSRTFDIQNITPGVVLNKWLFLDCIEREA